MNKQDNTNIYLAAEPKFSMGKLYATPGAVSEIALVELTSALHRHLRGDWGEVGPEDWEANDQSLSAGSRLLSSYYTKGGTKFWIITEADRSSTTVLLPLEY